MHDRLAMRGCKSSKRVARSSAPSTRLFRSTRSWTPLSHILLGPLQLARWLLRYCLALGIFREHLGTIRNIWQHSGNIVHIQGTLQLARWLLKYCIALGIFREHLATIREHLATFREHCSHSGNIWPLQGNIWPHQGNIWPYSVNIWVQGTFVHIWSHSTKYDWVY
jgi:hypothetical protein